ncbi:MAG: family 16 glycosylhydrolase [Tepidisphaeraceae bacterium]
MKYRAMLFALGCTASAALGQALPGWTLQWQDDFTAAALDGARWENLTRRDSYNNEKQYYTPSQVTQAGGVLRITASNTPLDGKAYRSGLVRTWAEQTYGRWEIRASLPSTQGMWPAIWLLPRNADWPSGGEIDIMENRGSAPTIVGSAYHYGATVAQHQWIAQDFAYSVNNVPVSFQGSMHTYAVEWDPSRIRYFIDGVPSLTFYNNAAPVSSTPMSLILNLAVGGDYGGDPDGSTVFPQKFDVDYVRVYQRAATPKLQNTSFETTAGEFFGEWSEYSNAANVKIDGAGNARTGSKAVQMYGRFDGNASNNSGLFQEVPALAGQVWQTDAWARNRPGDALAGTSVGRVKIEFVNASGDVLQVSQLDAVDASSPQVYRESLVRATAPAGTAFARAVIEMLQKNNGNGSVNFDDVSIGRVTSTAATVGDLNLDGVANSLDVDALLHSAKSGNALFDYTGNGVVDGADVDKFLSSAFHTYRGDIDLNGTVNFADLLVIAANYGKTGSGTWSTGDFDGDGTVNFTDLLLLAGHYGTTTGGTFASDWAMAQATVPEPIRPLSAAALLGMCGRRAARR